MIGETYLERGQPVMVLAAWRSAKLPEPGIVLGDHCLITLFVTRTGPRNVLIRREDGSLVVRPFRGLRRRPDVGRDAASLRGGTHG
jgi:acetyl esterase